MPAIHRLRTSREIRNVMQKGFLTRSPFFIARSVGQESGPPELAIVASKKRVGGAVVRNRARRRIRAAAIEAGLPNGQHVVVAHAQAVTTPFQDLVRQMQKVRPR